MVIENYFINLGWICIKGIDSRQLFEILDVKKSNLIELESGYELLVNNFDEKLYLNFEIEDWQFVIGKYPFLDLDYLKILLNELSKESVEVQAFAIDVWSNFYCYAQAIKGETIRFWNENDIDVISEGSLTKVESEIIEKETANRVLEIANKTTFDFKIIEDFLINNKIFILRPFR